MVMVREGDGRAPWAQLLPQLLDLRVCSGGGASPPLQAWDSSSGTSLSVVRLFGLSSPCLLARGQRSLTSSYAPPGIFAFKCSRAEEIFNLLQDLMQCNSINVMEEPVIITRNSHPAELGLPRAPQPPNGEETPSPASVLVHTCPSPGRAGLGGTRQAGRWDGRATQPSWTVARQLMTLGDE